jgi:hypothetical protein
MTEDEIKKGEALARAGGNDCAEWHSPDRLLALYAEVRRAEAAFRWIASKVTFAHGKALGGDLHGADLVKRALSEVSRDE